MEKEINKHIEEEAERYNIVSSIIDNKKSFKAGANFFIHQNRWRKVEEELPEVLTDVLIKDSFGKIDIGCLYDNGIWGMTPPIDRKITEWKPIE